MTEKTLQEKNSFFYFNQEHWSRINS